MLGSVLLGRALANKPIVSECSICVDINEGLEQCDTNVVSCYCSSTMLDDMIK